MPMSTELEVFRMNTWQRITVTEAIATNDRRGRCIKCSEPVRVRRESKTGMAAHVEHLKRNPECPLSHHL